MTATQSRVGRRLSLVATLVASGKATEAVFNRSNGVFHAKRK